MTQKTALFSAVFLGYPAPKTITHFFFSYPQSYPQVYPQVYPQGKNKKNGLLGRIFHLYPEFAKSIIICLFPVNFSAPHVSLQKKKRGSAKSLPIPVRFRLVRKPNPSVYQFYEPTDCPVCVCSGHLATHCLYSHQYI
jgi:hypothetical protein